jgi:hypothetical protein
LVPGPAEERSGSTEADELPLKEIPPMISERRKVLPQARQRATSVETLRSSVAIFERQDGQLICMNAAIMP